MPEGDAVLLTARRLHRALAGRRLRHAELRWGTADAAPLVGRQTLEVRSVGKHLLHRIEGGYTVHSHLRMEGRWRTRPTPEVTVAQRQSPRLRALFADEEWAALGFQLGLLELIPTAQEASVIGHLGPDLLGDSWDEPRAIDNLRSAPDRPLAEALLDQRNLAGLGTIFTSEPLFLERLGPWASVTSVSDEQLIALIRRARRMLQASVASGRPVSTGDARDPMYVFGRRGRPCRRCGTTVRRGTVGQPPQERVLSYCPRCQPAPT